jgi:hypothetical protein
MFAKFYDKNKFICETVKKKKVVSILLSHFKVQPQYVISA